MQSVFGMLDHLLRIKPRISTIAPEAYITFANNKTMEWLKTQDETTQKTLLDDCRREAKDLQKKFKTRKAAIEEGRR